jgi:RNase P/RNase MRP subunit POP5
MAKPLSPTLREKKRYMIFTHSGNVEGTFEGIRRSYSRLFGEFGLAQAGLLLLRNRSNDRCGVVRVNAHCVDMLKCSLSLIENDNPDCIRVSGIVKKAMEGIKCNQ